MSEYDTCTETETDTESDRAMTDEDYVASYDHEQDSVSSNDSDEQVKDGQYNTISPSEAAQIAADAAYFKGASYSVAAVETDARQADQPPMRTAFHAPTPKMDTVINMESAPKTRTEEDNMHQSHPDKCSAMMRAVLTVCTETCGGACEICKMFGEALREAVFNSSFYPRKMDMGRTSAVGGRLLFLVLVEVILLAVQLTILVVVGSDTELAVVVHTPFLKIQSASLISVPLGVYIYMFGGLSPSSPGAERVYTFYTVCEIARMTGDFVNLVRFGRAFDDYKHIIAALAPDLVPIDDKWDHGVCGRPHAVGIVLITACAIGLVCSLSNILSLLIQRGVMDSRNNGRLREGTGADGLDRGRPRTHVPPRNPDVRLRSQRAKNIQPQREPVQNQMPRQSYAQHSNSTTLQSNLDLMGMVFESD